MDRFTIDYFRILDISLELAEVNAEGGGGGRGIEGSLQMQTKLNSLWMIPSAWASIASEISHWTFQYSYLKQQNLGILYTFGGIRDEFGRATGILARLHIGAKIPVAFTIPAWYVMYANQKDIYLTHILNPALSVT